MSRSLKIKNPRTGLVDCEIEALDTAEIAALAEKARVAQKSWLSEGIKGRCEKISHLADQIEKRSESLVNAVETDTGRRRIAWIEVMSVIGSMRAWTSMAPGLVPGQDWIQGRSQPNYKHLNELVPYQLIGVISPWNFPLLLSFIDAVPALIAGGCVLIKPSEVTPRFAECLKGIIEEAGFDDIITFVQGDGATGAALIDHVDYICFTGSVPTGKKVAIKAAEKLIPANLELGGKDPLIITESADMDQATNLALRASVLATGQACQSIERIYVPASKLDEFAKNLTLKAKALKLNWPDIEKGHIGPFIFENQANIVAGQISDAVSKGATILTGGKILHHGGGKWLEPTVITNVNHDMEIMRKETFGPVIPVMGYETIENAIELANDTEYGLSGGVFASSIKEAKEIGNHIEAGAISLMDGALTAQYYEVGKQVFKNSGLGPSRMGSSGLLRFYRQKAYIANTLQPLTMDEFVEDNI